MKLMIGLILVVLVGFAISSEMSSSAKADRFATIEHDYSVCSHKAFLRGIPGADSGNFDTSKVSDSDVYGAVADAKACSAKRDKQRVEAAQEAK